MTIEVISFGCRLNAFEGEVIRGHAAGLRDTVIVNTCAVTAEAERQCRRAVARVRRDRPGAAIVVTGCAAQIAPGRWAGLPGVSRVVGNAEKLLAETWAGEGDAVGSIGSASVHQGAAAVGLAGRARAFLDVQQGCDHACTFCIIPQGRGPSRSLPIADAVRQARAVAEAGIAELVLTGVDLASYRDGETGLGGLVRRVLREVPELARLRLSSLDPAAIDGALWEALAEEERLMPHLHLSVQSGSDLVLKRMLRRHSRAQALAVIARARRLRPGVAIGADLIAGFPTEDEARHRETMAFLEEAEVPYLHVFPYSERPGTPAARMPAVAVTVRRARAAALREAGRAAAGRFHAGLVGQRLRVVVERGGAGHAENFARVRLQLPAEIGSIVEVTGVRADADGVEAG